MAEFDFTKLRRLDLGVLLTFLGLVRHKKAADVAAELGLTQSSISHTLKRLRDIFGDPLFIRHPHGLEPTSFAMELEPQIRQVVATLNNALDGPKAFDPLHSTKTLRMSALDHSMATILPRFVGAMRGQAPDMGFVVRSMGRDAATKAFARNDLDLAVGYFWNVPDTLICEPLVSEPYLIVGARSNPLMQTPLTLESYCAAGHVVVSQKGDMRGVVDRVLRGLGARRNVAVSVPFFFPALTIVGSSDLITALPATMVRTYAERFDLAFQEAPFAVRPFEISAVRHKRQENDPAVLWAIGLLRDVVGVSDM